MLSLKVRSSSSSSLSSINNTFLGGVEKKYQKLKIEVKVLKVGKENGLFSITSIDSSWLQQNQKLFWSDEGKPLPFKKGVCCR